MSYGYTISSLLYQLSHSLVKENSVNERFGLKRYYLSRKRFLNYAWRNSEFEYTCTKGVCKVNIFDGYVEKRSYLEEKFNQVE